MPFCNVDLDLVVYILNEGVPLSYWQRLDIIKEWRAVLETCPGVRFRHDRPDSLCFHVDNVKVDVQRECLL